MNGHGVGENALVGRERITGRRKRERLVDDHHPWPIAEPREIAETFLESVPVVPKVARETELRGEHAEEFLLPLGLGGNPHHEGALGPVCRRILAEQERARGVWGVAHRIRISVGMRRKER